MAARPAELQRVRLRRLNDVRLRVGDGDAIASYLQPLVVAADGRPARVYNFGHSGYYSTQERILFTRLVVAGHVPDVAVFVDGLNDSGAVDDVPMTMPRLAAGYRLFENSAFLTALNALPLATTARHVSRLLGIAPAELTPTRPPRRHVRTTRPSSGRPSIAIAARQKRTGGPAFADPPPVGREKLQTDTQSMPFLAHSETNSQDYLARPHSSQATASERALSARISRRAFAKMPASSRQARQRWARTMGCDVWIWVSPPAPMVTMGGSAAG